MSYITVRDLSLGYDTHVIAEGLNFDVNAEDYLCIVGENGLGKTTFMKMLLHLQEPESFTARGISTCRVMPERIS